MTKFDRYIYVGDIHGSEYLEEFIDKYNDGKTKFYFLGDYSDRGFYLYQNYLLMKKLVEEGKLEFVIGNHDLFFIFGEGLKKGKIQSKIQKTILEQGKNLIDYNLLQKYNKAMKDINGGEMNDRLLGINETFFDDEERDDFIEKINKEIADFLWEHGNIYLIDHNKNFLIHGGIPILPSQDIVGGIIKEKGGMVYGINYIKELNKGFKKLDLDLIYRIDAPEDIDNEYRTLNEMERFGDINVDNIYDFIGKRIVSCVWYNSSYYEGDKIKHVLQQELNKHGLKKIILGHWQNKILNFEYKKDEIENKYFKNNNILRIDRSHIICRKYGFPIGNLGYAILNNENELLEVGDFPGEFKDI